MTVLLSLSIRSVDIQKGLKMVCGHHQQDINIIGVLDVKWYKEIASQTRREDGGLGKPGSVGLADLASGPAGSHLPVRLADYP